MKKFIALVLLATIGLAHAQQPNDVMVRQRNSLNTGWLDRFLSPPLSGLDGLMYIDNTVMPPLATVVAIGNGMNVSAGVLSVPPAAWSSITGKPAFATVATSGAYADLTGNPSIPAAQVNSDWSSVSGVSQILNKPTIPIITAFNFGAPASRILAVSTQYQATDNTKASIVTVSASCVNVTSILASSACTIQVRQSSASGLTCSTGSVSMTWTSTVQLGLVFNQTSGSPFDVKIPAGGYFILCAQSGTFTINAVEQSAG